MLTALLLLLVALSGLGFWVHRQYPSLTVYWGTFSPIHMVDSVESLYWEVKIGRYHFGLRWQ